MERLYSVTGRRVQISGQSLQGCRVQMRPQYIRSGRLLWPNLVMETVETEVPEAEMLTTAPTTTSGLAGGKC